MYDSQKFSNIQMLINKKKKNQNRYRYSVNHTHPLSFFKTF